MVKTYGRMVNESLPNGIHYDYTQDEFEQIRQTEFPQLKSKIISHLDSLWTNQLPSKGQELDATIYLDSAASPPHAKSILENFSKEVSSQLFSNPHSRSLPSQRTADRIDNVRKRILKQLFGLDAQKSNFWDVVFTSGATDGLKLLSQTFPFSPQNGYAYLKQAHTSLVGIRASALKANANVFPLDLHQVPTWLNTAPPSSLFAYPAQCNVTGQRITLGLCQTVKRKLPECKVLIDGAAQLSTTPIDLSGMDIELAPDFIVCSFYKIFVRIHTTSESRVPTQLYVQIRVILRVSVVYWLNDLRVPRCRNRISVVEPLMAY